MQWPGQEFLGGEPAIQRAVGALAPLFDQFFGHGLLVVRFEGDQLFLAVLLQELFDLLFRGFQGLLAAAGQGDAAFEILQ
jgi:hypothetical protein